MKDSSWLQQEPSLREMMRQSRRSSREVALANFGHQMKILSKRGTGAQ